jgi:hypothetical protein
MDIQYIIAGFIVVIAMVYYKSLTVFAHARMGEDYLRSLLETPQKFDNNRVVLNQLEHNHLKNVSEFVQIEPRIQKILMVAGFVNLVGLVYPSTQLTGHWLGWILLLLLTIVNSDAIMTYFMLKRNKQIVSNICNGYYQYLINEKQKVNKDGKDVDE